MYQTTQFRIPRHLDDSQRLPYCMEIIGKYRDELPVLRKNVTVLKRQKQQAEDKAEDWKQKYQEEKQKNHELEKQIGKLEEDIERLTKTNNRYAVALFDHGNFKSVDSQGKKTKGGQPGHGDTNREAIENPQIYPRKRIYLSSCSECGTSVNRVTATQQKILFDIVLNPELVKLIVESERQWCSHCQKEVSATDEQSLPFTEYGINTLMMALLLRYRCLLSLSKISLVLSIGYGLEISQSGINSLFRQAKKYLGDTYKELKKTVREGAVMYNDETGWQVRGKNAWMWIMANEEATVYIAAESRGGGIAKEIYGNSQAYSMHDGLASYTSGIPQDKHLYCWAHVLRFAHEETHDKPPDHESIDLRDKLVELYHLKKNLLYEGKPLKFEREVHRRMNHLIKRKSKDSSVLAIQRRLRDQAAGLIRGLLVTPNGTNNFAEQELRPIALMRKISYGSDTYTGMETTAILASITQTLVRTKRDSFFPILATTLRAGVANS